MGESNILVRQSGRTTGASYQIIGTAMTNPGVTHYIEYYNISMCAYGLSVIRGIIKRGKLKGIKIRRKGHILEVMSTSMGVVYCESCGYNHKASADDFRHRDTTYDEIITDVNPLHNH